jgi:hypothetical protein
MKYKVITFKGKVPIRIDMLIDNMSNNRSVVLEQISTFTCLGCTISYEGKAM